MTQKKILEYKKRCAEFLGWKKAYEDGEDPLMYVIPKNFAWSKFYNISDEYEALTVEDLQFCESWEWMMEVVEKIKYIGNNQEKFFGEEYYSIHFEIDLLHGIDLFIDKERLFGHSAFGEGQLKEAVVKAINQFLIWYNKNKQICIKQKY